MGQGQTDRNGNPIPNEPGYEVIWNPDGELIRMRNVLWLEDGLTATDDPASQCTRIALGAAGGGLTSFDSVASLRALNSLPSDDKIYVTSGYYSPRDGGAAMYSWDPLSIESDDGGAIIKLTSRTTGRMKFVLTSNSVNIRQFGATEGIDCRDSIANSLAYCVSDPIGTGAVIETFVPAGKFELPYDGSDTDRGLIIPGGAVMVGSGRNSRLHNPMTMAEYDVMAGLNHNHVMVSLGDGGSQDISKIAFTGENGSADGTGFAVPTLVRGAQLSVIPDIDCDDVNITFCYFQNILCYSLYNPLESSRWNVSYNTLNYCGFTFNCVGEQGRQIGNVFFNAIGIENSGYGNGTITKDNIMSGKYTAGISIYANSQVCQGNVIDLSDVDTDPVVIGALAFGIIGGALTNSLIQGNSVISPRTAAIEVTSQDLGHGTVNPANVSVIGNTVWTNRTAATASSHGFLFQSVNGLTLVGNSIKDHAATPTLSWGMLFIGCSNVRCTGDIVENCYDNVSFSGCSDVVVTSPSSKTAYHNGMDVTSTTGISFVAGTCAGANVDISVDGTSTGLKLQGVKYSTSSFAITPSLNIENANTLAFANLTGASNKLAYFTGAGALSTADLTAAGRAIAGAANSAAQCTALGLVIGTDVQAHSPTLDTIVGTASSPGLAMLSAATANAQAALVGSFIPSNAGVLGDADTTFSVLGGVWRQLPSVTASRTLTWGVSDSPQIGDTMIVDVMRTQSFAIVCKDDTGTTKVTVPSGLMARVTARYDGTHFSNFTMTRI